MAVFLLLAREGAAYVPPACTTPPFADVPVNHPFCRWIRELAARGVTSGCGGGNYCPSSLVTRDQMAVFLLKTREGSAYVPPACTLPVAGEPASVDWQPVRSPPNEYVNGCAVVLSPGANAAVPFSWHPPPLAADAPGAKLSAQTPTTAATSATVLRLLISSSPAR